MENRRELETKIYFRAGEINYLKTEDEPEILDVIISVPIPRCFYIELEKEYFLVITLLVEKRQGIENAIDLIREGCVGIKDIDIIRYIDWPYLVEIGNVTDLFILYEILLGLLINSKLNHDSAYNKDFLLGFLNKLEKYSPDLLT